MHPHIYTYSARSSIYMLSIRLIFYVRSLPHTDHGKRRVSRIYRVIELLVSLSVVACCLQHIYNHESYTRVMSSSPPHLAVGWPLHRHSLMYRECEQQGIQEICVEIILPSLKFQILVPSDYAFGWGMMQRWFVVPECQSTAIERRFALKLSVNQRAIERIYNKYQWQQVKS